MKVERAIRILRDVANQVAHIDRMRYESEQLNGNENAIAASVRYRCDQKVLQIS